MIRMPKSGQRAPARGSIELPKVSSPILAPPEPMLLSDAAGEVVLIDPCPMTREPLVYMLNGRAEGLLVHGVPDASACQAEVLDLAMLNIHAAPVDTEETRRQLDTLRAAYGASLPIAVIADPGEPGSAADAVQRLGLNGYLPTSLSPAVAIAAIRLVLAGGTFIPLAAQSPALPNPVTGGELQPRGTDAAEGGRLTAREAEVLHLLRQGKPNKIIAFELAIAESTVKVHIRSIMKKLNATNRTQAALLPAADQQEPPQARSA
jgi:DNA-binding NarL/FixJ family response regulator